MDIHAFVLCSVKAIRANGNSPELFSTRITALQLVALCEALARDTNVDLLDLSHNDCTVGRHLQDANAATFGDVGADCVARLLNRNATLNFLLLEGNAITARGAEAIAASLAAGKCSLKLLNMANNPIGDMVRRITANYAHLMTVDSSYVTVLRVSWAGNAWACAQGAEAFASMLRTNKDLKMLDVGNCDIGLSGVLHLASALSEVPSPALETLILEGCHIMSPPQDHTTLGLAKMLSLNTNLKQLYLSKIGLRDCDLEVWTAYGKCSLLAVPTHQLQTFLGPCWLWADKEPHVGSS